MLTEVPRQFCYGCGVLAVAMVTATPRAEVPAVVESTDAARWVQGWIGGASGDGGWAVETGSGARLDGNLGTLPWGGGAAMTLRGETLQYGFEAGGLFSYENDEVDFGAAFADGLTTVEIAVDNELFVFEVFLGGLVAVSPLPWLRLHAAAGPALAWANVERDDTKGARVSGTGGLVTADFSDRDNDYSLELYGRVGVEVETGGGWTIGASGRYASHHFRFGGLGELELDEPLWLLMVGRRL